MARFWGGRLDSAPSHRPGSPERSGRPRLGSIAPKRAPPGGEPRPRSRLGSIAPKRSIRVPGSVPPSPLGDGFVRALVDPTQGQTEGTVPPQILITKSFVNGRCVLYRIGDLGSIVAETTSVRCWAERRRRLGDWVRSLPKRVFAGVGASQNALIRAGRLAEAVGFVRADFRAVLDHQPDCQRRAGRPHRGCSSLSLRSVAIDRGRKSEPERAGHDDRVDRADSSSTTIVFVDFI